MLERHELHVHVEYCTAKRPSRTGSLRGSAATYVERFQQLNELFTSMAGDATLDMAPNDPAHLGALAPGRRPMPAAGTARLPLQAAAWPDQSWDSKTKQSWPRLGAFEVSLTLKNTQSGKCYGPRPVYSKLETRSWPLLLKLEARKAQASKPPGRRSQEANPRNLRPKQSCLSHGCPFLMATLPLPSCRRVRGGSVKNCSVRTTASSALTKNLSRKCGKRR